MKPTKDNLITLNVLFIVCLIIANVVTAKVIDTGFSLGASPVLIPGAAITYTLTFLCTDIIGELWGKDEANKAVWRGFLAQFVALLIIISSLSSSRLTTARYKRPTRDYSVRLQCS